jgi:hypothetical protein
MTRLLLAVLCKLGFHKWACVCGYEYCEGEVGNGRFCLRCRVTP